MSIITNSLAVDVLLALILFVTILYFYLISGYDHWKNKSVPYLEPVVGFGSLLPIVLGKKGHLEMIHDIYKQFEGERFCGFYQFKKPTLMIRDPKLIEQILIKDFSHFEDRGTPIDENDDPLTINLVNLTGDKWRSLRHKLTPTFSSGKLKGIFSKILKTGEDLLEIIEELATEENEVVAKELTFMFTTDVIATCAFGLEFKFNTEEGRKFKEMVNKAVATSRIGALKLFIRLFSPSLAKFLGIRSTTNEVSEYFISITQSTAEHRLKNNIERNDFFQLLLSLQSQEKSTKNTRLNPETDNFDQDDIHLQYVVKPNSTENSLSITDEVVAAQTFVFLAAGSETLSTTMNILLHYLAQNPTVQEILQDEVDSVLTQHGGQWSYQALKNMTYLDQVIQESQRIFPIAYMHLRVCTKSYKIPDSEVVVDKGTAVVIPVIGLHMDHKYYPDPQTFNPDRFVGNNFKPSPIFSPFGDGPRICIAMRFAILELKIFIARIVSKYSVKPSPKTVTPLRLDPKSGNTRPMDIWVSFKRRNL